MNLPSVTTAIKLRKLKPIVSVRKYSTAHRNAKQRTRPIMTIFVNCKGKITDLAYIHKIINHFYNLTNNGYQMSYLLSSIIKTSNLLPYYYR